MQRQRSTPRRCVTTCRLHRQAAVEVRCLCVREHVRACAHVRVCAHECMRMRVCVVKVVPSPVRRHRSGMWCDTIDRQPRIPLPLLLPTGVAVLSSPVRTFGCVTVLRRASALSACRTFRPACDPELAGSDCSGPHAGHHVYPCARSATRSGLDSRPPAQGGSWIASEEGSGLI